MIKHLALLILTGLLLISFGTNAQVTQSLRVLYNETLNDEANKIITDNAGNIIISGTVADNTGIRIRTVKYDPTGNIIWQKKYKGPAFEDRVAGIALDNQNNIFVGGYSEGQDGVFHFLLIKYSASAGDSLFVKRRVKQNTAYDFAMDTQGNVYLGGDEFTPSGMRFCLMKYSSAGDTLWSILHQGSGIRSIDTDNSGNVYLTGDVFPNTCNTVKYNSAGVFQWVNSTQLFMGPNPLGKNLIVHDTQGNVYIAGYKYIDNQFREDMVVVKYNSAGSEVWNRRFIGEGRNDYTYSLTMDNAGNIIAAGNSYNPVNSSYDLLTLKYDPSGNLLWSKIFTKPEAHAYEPTSILTDGLNNIYIAGGRSNCFTLKYTPAGDTIWTAFTKGDAVNGNHTINDMKLDAAGNIFVTGVMTNTGNNKDMFFIKYTQSTTPVIQISEIADKFSLSQNYPNPFNPSTKIKFTLPLSTAAARLTVYNALGTEVETILNGQMEAGSFEIDFNAAGLPSGIYFYKLDADGFSDVRKMIFLK